LRSVKREESILAIEPMSDVPKAALTRPTVRYAMAIGVVVAAFLLRLIVTQYLGIELPPFITLFPAVMIAAILAGLWSGILATALAVLGTYYLILPPRGHFAIAKTSDIVALALFSAMGILMSLVAEHYRRTLRTIAAYKEKQDLACIEQELRESEILYRNLFNSMDEGFCIIEVIFDAEGKAIDYRFLEVNSAFERQTGLHEAVGKRMRDLAPSHEEHWFETYGNIALTGESAHFVHVAKALNRSYEVSAYRVGEPALHRVAIVFKDISVHVRAEEHIRQLNRRKGMASKVKFEAKLIGAFVFIALIATVTGVTSLINIRKMAQADRRLYDDATVPLPELTAIAVSVQRVRIASRDFIASQGEPARRATFKQQIDQLAGEIARTSDAFQRRNLSPEMRNALGDFMQYHKSYEGYLAQILGLATAGKDKEALDILWSDSYNKITSGEIASIDHMDALNIDEAEKLSEQNNSLARTAAAEVVLAILAGLVFALVLGFWLIRSIAERTRAERSREELASIVDHSDAAIISKSLDGTIINWNKGAEDLYGYLAEEVIGHPISILLPPDRPDEISEIIAKVRLGEAVSEETVRRRKDGELVDVTIIVSPIRNSLGQVTAASSIARDISQQKRSEQRIMDLNAQFERAAAEAEAANRAKSTFLSTMSHEIRTPMNAILGYSQLMLRDSSLGKEAKANLKIIGRSGEHLLGLITDVLDMSKIEAGRVELNPTTFSLVRLLSDLEAMFRLRAGVNGLRFEMSLDGEAVPYVVTDEGKVRQVLINLLGNAVKFTQVGQIKLLATLEQRDADQLWLSARVEDTGVGIADEDQKKLFESFSQARSGVGSLQGTGLGLAISRKYARLMGGDITVTSNPGSGSVFRFEVPIGRGEAGVALKRVAPRRVIAIRAAQEAPKILVADDHFENRDWLTKLLSSVGFSVRGADNGETAIRIWEEWNPGLILMDVHMPIMDGLEATRKIKADLRGKETAIVVLTASAMDSDRRAVARCGADGFVAKPCHEDDLLEKMRTLLRIAYDYEETSMTHEQSAAGAPVLNSERLRLLPRELIEEIRNATLTGNKKLLDELILKVPGAGDAESAQGLQELADRYEYDALTQLLEEACRP
jgi:PAS domain S-box-containing protein